MVLLGLIVEVCTARRYLAGAGIQTAALAVGGKIYYNIKYRRI
jgi:hypothetical protein